MCPVDFSFLSLQNLVTLQPAMAENWNSISLRLAKYSRAYKQRLLGAFSVLREFLASHGLSTNQFLELPRSQTDVILERFISEMHERSKSKKSSLSVAKHAVLFTQVAKPRLRFQLKATWASIKAWEEQQPSQLRAPLPLPILMGLLCQSRLFAETELEGKEREKIFRFAALVGLCFFSLLRPGELLKLTKEDVDLPNQVTFGAPCVTIRIRKPKNYRQLGHNQFSVIRQPDTCNWVSWAFHHTKNAGDKLWPHTSTEFRKIFKQQCNRLLGKGHSFSPASLRAGGATFLFDMSADVNRLRLLGRWAHVQSLEHYIQLAKSQQLTLSIRPKAVQRIISLLQSGSFLLALPLKYSHGLRTDCLLSRAHWSDESQRSLWARCRIWGSASQEV